MDEARIKVLSQELDAATRQRGELDVVIEYLSKLVGRTPEGSRPSEDTAEAQAGPGADGSTELAREGEFFGTSSVGAAVVVLTRVGRSHPLKTDALHEALTKGGVKITQDALYRGLFRSSKFTRVGKSLWGLSEWYPQRAVKAARSAANADDAFMPDEQSEVTAQPSPGDSDDGRGRTDDGRDDAS